MVLINIIRRVAIMEKQRFFYVDMIKVLSALIVMLFHFNVEAWYRDNTVELLGPLKFLNISLGDIAISQFIIISGMTLSLTNPNTFSSFKFFKRRLLSIYPSFWISYLFVAFFIIILTDNSIGDGHLWKLVLTLLGLDGFFLYKMTSYYLVGEWYTGYMLLTYLFFPFIFLYGIKKPIITGLLLVSICILIHYNYNKIFDVYETCNPIMRLPDFFFGMCFGFYIRHNKLLLANLFFLSIFYLLLYEFFSDNLPYHFFMIIGGISFFVIIVQLVSYLRLVESLVGWMITYLSQFTFLAFLVHHQIINFIYSHVVMFSQLNLFEKSAMFSLVVFLSFGYAVIINPLVNRFTAIFAKVIDFCSIYNVKKN